MAAFFSACWLARPAPGARGQTDTHSRRSGSGPRQEDEGGRSRLGTCRAPGRGAGGQGGVPLAGGCVSRRCLTALCCLRTRGRSSLSRSCR